MFQRLIEKITDLAVVGDQHSYLLNPEICDERVWRELMGGVKRYVNHPLRDTKFHSWNGESNQAIINILLSDGTGVDAYGCSLPLFELWRLNCYLAEPENQLYAAVRMTYVTVFKKPYVDQNVELRREHFKELRAAICTIGTDKPGRPAKLREDFWENYVRGLDYKHALMSGFVDMLEDELPPVADRLFRKTVEEKAMNNYTAIVHYRIGRRRPRLWNFGCRKNASKMTIEQHLQTCICGAELLKYEIVPRKKR